MAACTVYVVESLKFIMQKIQAKLMFKIYRGVEAISEHPLSYLHIAFFS